jgi:peptidoglycan/LPS O-acetylase OafA/YrhL
MSKRPARGGAAAVSVPLNAPLVWLDLVKGAAILWIFTNHLAERLFGAPYAANPFPGWPLPAAQWAQWTPVSGYGLADIPLNLIRYTGWLGDYAVGLFLVASGLGLTWGLLAKRAPDQLALRAFYARRLRRLYPAWWVSHAAVFLLLLAVPLQLDALDARFFLSAAGIRFTPDTYYYLVPAWWFVGLLLQLYLIYPALWWLLRRVGALPLLLGVLLIALPVRSVGLFALTGYLDPWSRGALFITRLPEFVLGMACADWLYRHPAAADRLRHPLAVAAALTAFAAAVALSVTLAGMTVTPLIASAALGALGYALFAPQTHVTALTRPLKWAGDHSYALYLTHHLVLIVLVAPLTPDAGLVGVTLRIAAALVVTPAAALALEAVTNRLLRLPARRLAAGAAAVVAVLIGGELLVRQVDPQEVNGWGERPALQPDTRFGWTLIPSQVTRLRWVSYDYTVTATALGFPAPEYPPERAPGTLRLLVTGDAFTSAEGVDTPQAWPRLLESVLAARLNRPVEVLNFALTGYGPQHYAAVIQAFAPVYVPDRVLIGWFVNDFADTQVTPGEFAASIGFDAPPPDDPITLLTLAHLRRWLHLYAYEPLLERITSRPGANRWFLGQFAALERAQPDAAAQVDAARRALESARAAAGDAPLTLVLIPAAVQVCDPSGLRYVPAGVDLADAARFDVDRPQRLATALAAELGLDVIDLRAAFAGQPCPYQPENLHWLESGHALAADAVASHLAADGSSSEER